MNYRIMTEEDISAVIPMYIDNFNKDGGEWTETTVYKRIHQVWSREDSYCLAAEEDGKIIAFAMGYFEQYDDGSAYDLIETVVEKDRQNEGIGSEFMTELESRVKEKGAMLIQLAAVNDEMHKHFYGKLGYKTVKNFVLKTKIL